MGKLIHTSRMRIEKVKGPLRHAYVEGFVQPQSWYVDMLPISVEP